MEYLAAECAHECSGQRRACCLGPGCGYESRERAARTGAGGTYEAQLWFSTYGLPQERVTELETRWKAEFQKILQA